MVLPNVRTNEGVSVYCSNGQHTVRREHVAFKKMMECINNGDEQGFLELLNSEDVVSHLASGATNGTVSFNRGKLYVGQTELDRDRYGRIYDIFLNRIEGLLNDGLSLTPLLNFISNLLDNPSMRSIDQAYEFIERNKLPLTDDGYFLAYKSLRDNYLDKHSGTVDNTPGKHIEMKRSMVDDNPDSHCSHGYHVGALSYSGPNGWFHNRGDKVVIVKVNPKDIVSVPTDHNCQKCRVCAYDVLSDYEEALNSRVYASDGKDVGTDQYDGFSIDCFDNLCEDDELVFKYHDKVRHAIVSHLNEKDWLVTCILVEPETDAGQYRTFKWCDMFDVVVVG